MCFVKRDFLRLTVFSFRIFFFNALSIFENNVLLTACASSCFFSAQAAKRERVMVLSSDLTSLLRVRLSSSALIFLIEFLRFAKLINLLKSGHFIK